MKNSFSVDIDCDPIWVYESDLNINFRIKKNLIFIQALNVYLKLLKKYKLKATFFVIAKDLKIKDNVIFFKKAIIEGHQIGNHTFNHYSNFSKKNLKVVNNEIYKAHDFIKKKLKITPKGFRAPSYNINPYTDNILSRLNYKYDSSHLPGFSTFLYKIFFLINKKKKSFSVIKNFFSKNKFQILNNLNLYRFPIATSTFFRFPIHPSVVYFLGKKYFNFFMKNLSNTSGHHALLFHAADLFNADQNHDKFKYFFNKSYDFRFKLIEMYFKKIKNKVIFKEDLIKTNN